MKNFTFVALSALTLSGTMHAAILTTSSSTGLGTVGITPYYSLSFDNAPGLSTNSSITNQFAAAGVSFSNSASGPSSANAAYYDGNAGGGGCGFANESVDCITNFTTSSGNLVIAPSPLFSILFSTPQTYAAFAIVTDPNGQNNTTITAYRNNVIVDSSTFTTSTTNPLNFVGFYGESTPFDRILITTTGSHLLMIDNLQVSAVPEPGTVGMFSAGILGITALLRRRRLV